jgi:hypothetical protein
MTIDEQLALCAAATRGLWETRERDGIIEIVGDRCEHECDEYCEDGCDSNATYCTLIATVRKCTNGENIAGANAKLIADARTHYPAALRAMEAIRDVLDAPRSDELMRGVEIQQIIKAFERGEF